MNAMVTPVAAMAPVMDGKGVMCRVVFQDRLRNGGGARRQHPGESEQGGEDEFLHRRSFQNKSSRIDSAVWSMLRPPMIVVPGRLRGNERVAQAVARAHDVLCIDILFIS
jgi:hypothetical protein